MNWPDYLIFAVFLVISLGIGIYHAFSGGKQKTPREFILANRRLSVIPTMLSMLVSFQSAIAILGYAAEMYTRGSQALVLYCLMYTVAILLSERLIVPWLYPLHLTSINEYFQLRYDSRTVRIFASAIGIIWQVLYMGTAIYAPSAALEEATGFPVMISIPIMASVCTVYTALGGIRAVIWTDVFQFLIMTVGMLTILGKGIVEVGGFGRAVQLCEENGRLHWADINPDPRTRHTVWGFLFGFSCTWTYFYGLNQASFQRYTSTKSLKQARLTLLLNLPMLYLMTSISCVTGLVVFAYYASTGCDVQDSGQVSNSNQILPHFVTRIFRDVPAFSGLFLAMLYSGALSSVSSSLSGSAANTWEDICKCFGKCASLADGSAAKFNKLLVILYGICATGVAFLAMLMPGPLTQIAGVFGGACGGPLLGLFLLSGTFRRANWQGAASGIVFGFAVNLWLSAGAISIKDLLEAPLPGIGVAGCADNNTLDLSAAFSNYTTSGPISTFAATKAISGVEHVYTLSYVWLPLIGCLFTVVVGLCVSFITDLIKKTAKKDEAKDVPDEYMIPYGKILSCCDYISKPTISCDTDDKERSDISKSLLDIPEKQI